MKTTKILAITMAAAITFGGFTVLTTHAANAKGSQLPLRAKQLQRAKTKLGITDEQARQIKAVIKADKDNIKGLVTKLHDARTSMREAIRASDANETSVRAASAKVAAAEADVAVERMKLFAKISPILTDTQRKKLAEVQSRVDEFVDNAINNMGEHLAD